MLKRPFGVAFKFERRIIMDKRYGCGSIIFDMFMTVITGGFWLIWVAVKYLRTH